MAATKKSKKSAAPKKSAAKKAVAKILPVAKKAKMGRPATYRYFTATVKFRLMADDTSGVRALKDSVYESLDNGRVVNFAGGLKVTVSEDKK